MVVVLIVPRCREASTLSFFHSDDVLVEVGGGGPVSLRIAPTHGRFLPVFFEKPGNLRLAAALQFYATLKPDVHTILMMNLMNHWRSAC